MLNVPAMKWGTLYGPHYVHRLYASIFRYLLRDFRFVCFTDDKTGTSEEVECHPISTVEFPVSEKILAEYGLKQEYVTRMAENQIRRWLNYWVRSFREHYHSAFPFILFLNPPLPSGAKIVAFHGLPKLDDARRGYLSLYPHKICRPFPWIDQHRTDEIS